MSLRPSMGAGYSIPFVIPRVDRDPRSPLPPIDVATVVGGSAIVTKPSGAQLIWALSLGEATPLQAVLLRALADNDLDEVGTWRAWIELDLAGGAKARTTPTRFEVIADDDLEEPDACGCAHGGACSRGCTSSHQPGVPRAIVCPPKSPTTTVYVETPPPVVSFMATMRGLPGEQGPPGPQGPPGQDGGLTVTKEAAITLSGQRVVKAAGLGTVTYCDVLTPGDALLGFGISTQAANAGDPIVIAASGELVDPSWSWTPGQPIYCGPSGILTQTIGVWPWIRIVAIATSATTLTIVFNPPIIV